MILFDTGVVIDPRGPDSEFHERAKQQTAEVSGWFRRRRENS
jgi:hypothetical protein